MDLFVVLAMFAWLILFFAAIIFHEPVIEWIGAYLCKKGRHSFRKKQYHCKRCKKPRSWPILTCIQGDKKDKPIFPRI